MENKIELSELDLILLVGTERAKEIIIDSKGKKIFYENTMNNIDDYIISYE